MNHSSELQAATLISRRILQAAESLLSDQPLLPKIRLLCHEFDKQAEDILVGRGMASVVMAMMGAKGQGKTWVIRQFLLSPDIRQSLPSGVLAREATTKLCWIGPMPPGDLDGQYEQFISCPASSMLQLPMPYVLLDLPGFTDANSQAAEAARQAISIAPIQGLVIRRDQLRSSVSSPLVNRSEGILCLPIVTAISPRECSLANRQDDLTNQMGVFDGKLPTWLPASLRDDLLRWLEMIRRSAPSTRLTAPIFVEDFEASGDEEAAGDSLRKQIVARCQSISSTDIAVDREHRMASATNRLKAQLHELIHTEAPQLAQAVQRLLDESRQLPSRVVESMLGSPLLLETALRARLRAQWVNDTSPLWFPYRATLSLLSLTHGAWDRLLLAMTGSVPSMFGTMVAWARNVYQTRKIELDTQQGLHERLQRQVLDQLAPMQQQFHRALSKVRSLDSPLRSNIKTEVVLRGIDELQTRSQVLFEQFVERHRINRWLVNVPAIVGTLIFWSLLFGPIISIYREYLLASYHTIFQQQGGVEQFPHPGSSVLATSVILSFLPLLLFAMVVLAGLLRRGKIRQLSQSLTAEHHALVEELQRQGILRLDFEDEWLAEAQFLLSLDHSSASDRT